MGKIYLKAYLNDIVEAYEIARAECSKLWGELEEAQKRNTEIQNSRAYTREGKRQAQTDFEGKRDIINAKLNKAVETAQDAFAEARTKADSVFGDLYAIRPQQIDMAALELLKSDVLSNSELVEMAERYRENPAMSRLCGKYAEERSRKNPDDTALRLVAADGRNTRALHLEGIDTLTMWAGKGLRVDNRLLSDGVAKEFPTAAAQILKDYGEINVEL